MTTRVSIIACGSMSVDITWLLLAPGRAMRSRYNRHEPAEWVHAASYCVLVETPEGRLLWDTSIPRDWEERWEPMGANDYFPYDHVSEEEYFDSRLTELGLAPGDIDYVVFSHLHYDHAGNAKLFQDTGAKLVCSAAEKDFALGFDGVFKGGHLKSDYEGLQLDTLTGDTQFLPGVTFLQTPGHTPGSMSMQVDLPDSGTMIFTGDAIFLGDSYGPPTVPPVTVDDLDAFYASVEKIRSIAEKTDATVVFGHDADQISRLRTAPGASYT